MPDCGDILTMASRMRSVLHPAWAATSLALALAGAWPRCLAGEFLTGTGQAMLTVYSDEPGLPISPLLHGAFFEEISHAGDGGLYAELVRNRSFEDSDRLTDWVLAAGPSAEATLALETNHLFNASQAKCLKLHMGRLDTGARVRVINEGYWGIPLRSGEEYALSFYARCQEGLRGTIQASLESTNGLVYACQEIAGVEPSWKRWQATLVSGGDDPAARLVLSFSQAGTFYLDMVSLFPKETWKGRPNGLRTDLAEKVRELKPAFLRFPGGCYTYYWRWKKTIGDVAERPAQPNHWGYNVSNGLGFHEYLQMSEDLGAEPVFCATAGLGPIEQAGEFIQDVLDALEYANGPPTSTWGGKRVSSGHPRPFGLQYIEVGNELAGPDYEERFKLFAEAIRARFPEVKLISASPVSIARPDIIDEHYYAAPEYFRFQAHRYDNFERQGPKIFVGELACTTQGAGSGNLRAALAEAEFMMGLERNSDVVVMAAYAPLLANAHFRQWNPSAVLFDSSSCFGTPSYYVQKLFAENRGRAVLRSVLDCETSRIHPLKKGGIGLKTFKTGVEFDDLSVLNASGQCLLSNDFSNGAPGWRAGYGSWKVEAGVYRQSDQSTDGANAEAGETSWTDYTTRLRLKLITKDGGVGILLRRKDPDHYLMLRLGASGNTRHALERYFPSMHGWHTDGSPDVLRSIPGSLEAGRWYDVKIEVGGCRVRAWLEDALLFDVSEAYADPNLPVMSAIATKAGEQIILKVVNSSGRPQQTRIVLEGKTTVESKGTATILTSHSLEDENSFAEPARVSPVTSKIERFGKRFDFSFPAYSLTVLRLGEHVRLRAP